MTIEGPSNRPPVGLRTGLHPPPRGPPPEALVHRTRFGMRPPREPPGKKLDVSAFKPRDWPRGNAWSPAGQRLWSALARAWTMDLLLPNGMLAQLDDEDSDLAGLAWRAWFNKGFRKTWIVVRDEVRQGRRFRVCLHREVGLRMSGLKSTRMVVDPLDRNFLNCSRSNLHVHETRRSPTRRWWGKVRYEPKGYDYCEPVAQRGCRYRIPAGPNTHVGSTTSPTAHSRA